MKLKLVGAIFSALLSVPVCNAMDIPLGDIGGDITPYTRGADDVNESWSTGEGFGREKSGIDGVVDARIQNLYERGKFIEVAQQAVPLKESSSLMWYWYHKSILALAQNDIYVMDFLSERHYEVVSMMSRADILVLKKNVDAMFARAFQMLDVVRRVGHLVVNKLQLKVRKEIMHAIHERRLWRACGRAARAVVPDTSVLPLEIS